MIFSYKGWRNCFLFSFGLFLGTAFCMKWMEPDFVHQGSLFTIIGLEITYDKARIMELFSQLTDPVRRAVFYHLYFDFAFMAGTYTGIAALCMMARFRVQWPWLKQFLFWLAVLQLLAWICDIRENLYLLSWLKEPIIGKEFRFYHPVVIIKWVLALAGILIAVPALLRKSTPAS